MTASPVSVHPSTLPAVVDFSARRWGHSLDSVDRAAVRLALADQWLVLVAGTDEDTENAAYHEQSAAFGEWWDACTRSEHVTGMDRSWIMDVSYGGAVGEVRAFLRSQRVEGVAA